MAASPKNVPANGAPPTQSRPCRPSSGPTRADTRLTSSSREIAWLTRDGETFSAAAKRYWCTNAWFAPSAAQAMPRPAKLPAMIDSAAAIAASPAPALASAKPARRPIRRMMVAAGYVHSPSPTTFSATGRVASAGSGASTSPDSPPTSTIRGTADRFSMVAIARTARLARAASRPAGAAGSRIARSMANAGVSRVARSTCRDPPGACGVYRCPVA